MAEIRIRNASNELMTQAEKIQQHFNVKTITGALEQVIDQYFQDQETIKQLGETNEQQEDKIRLLMNREWQVKNLLDEFIRMQHDADRYAKRMINSTASLLKVFTAKKSGTKKKAKKRSIQRSQSKRKKIVPSKKKGGKK